jgi:transcriptional regulator with XRE-family HTH domain
MQGRDMKQIRKALRLSAVEFGRALGYEGTRGTVNTTIRRYESNGRDIPPWIARLAEMFKRHGVPPEWIPVEEEATAGPADGNPKATSTPHTGGPSKGRHAPPLRLFEGRQYLTMGGQVVGPMEPDDTYPGFPFADPKTNNLYTAGGLTSYDGRPREEDIVSEVSP